MSCCTSCQSDKYTHEVHENIILRNEGPRVHFIGVNRTHRRVSIVHGPLQQEMDTYGGKIEQTSQRYLKERACCFCREPSSADEFEQMSGLVTHKEIEVLQRGDPQGYLIFRTVTESIQIPLGDWRNFAKRLLCCI